MEKQSKLDIESCELVALASSLAICISQKYSSSDVCTIRQFLATLVSNLALIEHQDKYCKSFKDKKI